MHRTLLACFPRLVQSSKHKKQRPCEKFSQEPLEKNFLQEQWSFLLCASYKVASTHTETPRKYGSARCSDHRHERVFELQPCIRCFMGKKKPWLPWLLPWLRLLCVVFKKKIKICWQFAGPDRPVSRVQHSGLWSLRCARRDDFGCSVSRLARSSPLEHPRHPPPTQKFRWWPRTRMRHTLNMPPWALTALQLHPHQPLSPLGLQKAATLSDKQLPACAWLLILSEFSVDQFLVFVVRSQTHKPGWKTGFFFVPTNRWTSIFGM